MPKNTFGPNLVLNRVASTGFNIAGAPTAPPVDGEASADSAINGSIAVTPTGVYQRLATVWTALASTGNNVTGRFITGTAVITSPANNVSIPILPTGASNGDRVFVTPNTAVTNNALAVVMYSAEITGGNLVITALDNAGAPVATGTNPSIFYMIDTST